eukprot:CAMPEP_0181126974 /NCGR_PEP_ID=MMETSP1071-20121207/27935_1 /TAXON_ID=35127 /ORGANISM="Thalassiosira sp., Strain NH16" /LENGTH=378 /DNA_ID=CAMNT_0023212651 /DNA_START=172 /DNA_END=1305 /DNA_ORIENTATION=+
MRSIPVIDISPLVRLGKNGNAGVSSSQHLQDEQLNSVIDQISHACESFGFFAVTNHGVDPDIITSAWDASKNYFDLEPAIKESVPMTSSYPYGYESHESLGTAAAAAAATATVTAKCCTKETTKASSAPSPDSKETFSIGPIDPAKSGMPSRMFPRDAPATFAPAMENYFTIMENLARILFRGLALALQLDDASWFLREGHFDEGHQCALRILNYPELRCNKEEGGSKDVRIRAGAHTDYGAMTILKSGGPGLQLQLSSRTTNGETSDDGLSSWIDVPHLSDSFVINLGDLMQRWTNDRWRSTLHRVIAVSDGNGPDQEENDVFQSSRRQSIAFFVNMKGNATIVPFDSCVDNEHPSRYDSIKASDHLIQRHAQSMGT